MLDPLGNLADVNISNGSKWGTHAVTLSEAASTTGATRKPLDVGKERRTEKDSLAAAHHSLCDMLLCSQPLLHIARIAMVRKRQWGMSVIYEISFFSCQIQLFFLPLKIFILFFF